MGVLTNIDVRSAIFPLTKRYRTDILSQKLIMFIIKFYTDNIFSDDTSVRGNKCAHIYADGDGFVHILPMRSKLRAGVSVGNVVKYIGAMNEIHCDNTLEQVGKNSEFMKNTRNYNIHVSSIKPYSPCQNKAENYIQIINGRAHRHLTRCWVPKISWSF